MERDTGEARGRHASLWPLTSNQHPHVTQEAGARDQAALQGLPIKLDDSWTIIAKKKRALPSIPEDLGTNRQAKHAEMRGLYLQQNYFAALQEKLEDEALPLPVPTITSFKRDPRKHCQTFQ